MPANLAKRQFNGILLMVIGAFIGFISCVLSLINPIPEFYGIFLYGLTSIAIILALIGLYFLLE
ncbi:hypothetical protein L0U88_14545 [Flavihumibacter sp. RY-1]|uniref:Lipoprotein n=1 Tax=Flavihumibacter fluminis TaxID=2909236 RepID=A0ABS9BKH7_9BACT|nr:hypothetical protein [Flavihumibacter fluminis]MCF1715855.1 hypothetical protein [Flavihumibacter fluminis]